MEKNRDHNFFARWRKTFPYSILFVLLIIAAIFFYFSLEKKTGSIEDGGEDGKLVMGVVTDIHSGNKKHRNYGNGNELNPRDYCINLQKVFSQSKADFFVALGDITLDGGDVEAERVLDCIEKFAPGKEFIWVMGNHDDDRTWKALGQQEKYYSVEKGDWKIIVLYDSVYEARTEGGVAEEQLTWLEKELNTDKKVVIAQHHPLWGKKDDPNGSIVSSGVNLEKEAEILSRYSNVKYVLAGHAHKDHFCLEKGSYQFCRVKALGLKEYEGSFMDIELTNER